jgi:hypothetical protein
MHTTRTEIKDAVCNLTHRLLDKHPGPIWLDKNLRVKAAMETKGNMVVQWNNR